MGGGRPKDIRDVLKGGSSGGFAFWVGDVGPDPPYRVVFMQFPEHGYVTDKQETAKESEGGELVVSSTGSSNRGDTF